MNMNRTIYITILLIYLFPLNIFSAEPLKQPKKWAVVVGIDNYLKDVTPLHCAANDAREFKSTLINDCGFSEDDVFLLTSDQKGNRMPDKANIVRWISYIKSQSQTEDIFIFFFSGHGMDMENESYLLTMEADPFSKDTLDVSSLKLGDLKKYLSEMNAGLIISFVDACRNDPRTGKGQTDNRLTENFSKNLIISSPKIGKSTEHTFATFFSCKVGQRSYEWSEKTMGFFTYYLIKGLKGEASDKNGFVSLNSLEKYIGTNVPASVERERGCSQDPWVLRNGPSGCGEALITGRISQLVKNNKTSKINSNSSNNTESLVSNQTAKPSQNDSASQETAYIYKEMSDFIYNIRSNELSETKKMLERNPSLVNKKDERGNIPIIEASSNGCIEIIEFLLKNGANINSRDSGNGTALSWAVFNNQIKAVSLLLSKGADIESKDDNGCTVLHWAAWNGQNDMVKLLLQKGADINAKDKNRNTPLYYANLNKKSETAEILRKLGGKE